MYNGNWIIPTIGLVICLFYATTTAFFQFASTVTGSWVYISHTNTVVFLCIELMFVCCILWTYVGRPFKKPIYCNVALTVLLVVDIGVGVALFFITPNRFLSMLEIGVFYGGVLLGITLATLCVHAVYTVGLKVLGWTQ